MAAGSSADIYRDIQTLFDAGTATGLSDRQLLEQFSSRRDGSGEAAFEAIVQRHGPMVLRVCHKVLGNHADADEAFQATFLILVKKSRSIRNLDTVGGWLFGVAGRVAARARVERARRRSAEQQKGLRIGTAMDTGGDDGDRLDLNPAVEAEVLRLPEKYRAVVVLCYWEGLTHEQAAARLGCPLGTIRSRMARARKLLHRRLSRRGLEPVAGAMAAAFDSPSALTGSVTEIPKSLLSSTVQLAVKVGAGRSIAELGSPSIAALVQTVIGSMFMTKLKTIAVCSLLIGAGAYGLTLAAAQSARGRRIKPEAEQRAESAKSKSQPPFRLMNEYVVEPPDLILVEVLEALPGRPISGERLVRPDGKISLGFYGDVYVAGLTLREIKEKIILHLRKYLPDETLGLLVEEGTDEMDDTDIPPPSTGEGRSPFDRSRAEEGPMPPAGGGENPFQLQRDDEKPKSDVPHPGAPSEQARHVEPRDSDRVFVDVTAYNSKNYYMQGEFLVTGRLPVTGQERVLDAINFAGGLMPDADHDQVFLYREGAKGAPVRTFKIDIDQILLGDDLSTNYQVLAGDKIAARRRKSAIPKKEEAAAPPSAPIAGTATQSPYFNRSSDMPADAVEAGSKQQEGSASSRRLEKRISEMERKLDMILETLKRQAR